MKKLLILAMFLQWQTSFAYQCVGLPVTTGYQVDYGTEYSAFYRAAIQEPAAYVPASTPGIIMTGAATYQEGCTFCSKNTNYIIENPHLVAPPGGVTAFGHPVPMYGSSQQAFYNAYYGAYWSCMDSHRNVGAQPQSLIVYIIPVVSNFVDMTSGWGNAPNPFLGCTVVCK